MFIKKTKNQKGQSYYHVVESYRDGKKVRQRTLLSLGSEKDGNLEKLMESASRFTDMCTATQLAKNISVKETFILGPLLILEKLFDQLGIDQMMKKITKSHKKLEFDLRKIIFTLVAGRFVHPSSKLKVYEHWQKSFYPKMLEGDIPLHQLYRAMDLLAEHKENIEQRLFCHKKTLFDYPLEVVLYDLTTLRFESTRTDLGKLRQFGYSKEMRTDCTQVVFGLLVDTDGIPLGFEVYPGNTFEGKTLSGIVDKVKEKFGVRRFIFVADRGLFSKDNLKKLSENSGEFIAGMKMGILNKDKQEDLYNIDNFEWIQKDKLAVYETEYEGYRCIVTWSRSRDKRDKAIRGEVLKKIEKKLSSKKNKTVNFVSNKSYKKYVNISENKEEEPTLNENAIKREEKKDGFFAVVSNVKDMSTREIIINYKDLWKIEDAFGEFKGTLKARPMFHWTDHRIIGHLTLCFLAYLCEAHLIKKLREKNIILKSPTIGQGHVKERALTVVEAMRELKEVRAIPVKVRGQTIWVRTDIKDNASALFRAAQVKIPPKMLSYHQM